MPLSTVNITPGTGDQLDAFQRTINSVAVKDQATVRGLPYLGSYTMATAAGLSTATAASHLLQIMAGGTNNVYVKRIRVWQVVLAGAAAKGDYSIRRLSTAGTGGTGVTPIQLDTTDGAAGATGMTLPTVKGTVGNPIFYRTATYLSAWPTAGGPTASLIAFFEFGDDYLKAFRIPVGAANGLAVQNDTGIATATVTVELEFFEAAF